MEAYHAYNVPSIVGIPYGLEGFIPKYRHALRELTPDVVADIHRFGGTILGSSRGPQSPEEIVDTLERCNVNALFVIGGDGTMKAALSISREVQNRGLKIDLGIEVSIEELPIIQRRIIRHCHRLGRRCIVATHMLESMIDHFNGGQVIDGNNLVAFFLGHGAQYVATNTSKTVNSIFGHKIEGFRFD